MTNLTPKDQKRVEEIKKTIESVLLNRIKHIGDDEQLYTGYPVQLIDELATILLTQKNAEIETAMEAEREKCIATVRQSCNVDEHLGVSVQCETARQQAIVDLLAPTKTDHLPDRPLNFERD